MIALARTPAPVTQADLAEARAQTHARGTWWSVRLQGGQLAHGPILLTRFGDYRLLHMAVCRELELQPDQVLELTPVPEDEVARQLQQLGALERALDHELRRMSHGHSPMSRARRLAMRETVRRLRLEEGLTFVEISDRTKLPPSTAAGYAVGLGPRCRRAAS